MFSIDIFKSLIHRELQLNYTFIHHQELQILVDSFNCDFDLFLYRGLYDNINWLYAHCDHSSSNYLGAFSMFNKHNLTKINNISYIKCKDNFYKAADVYVFFIEDDLNKGIVHKRLKRIKELKAFI